MPENMLEEPRAFIWIGKLSASILILSCQNRLHSTALWHGQMLRPISRRRRLRAGPLLSFLCLYSSVKDQG